MKTKHICLVLVAASLLAGCVKDSIKENISSGQSADLELASVNSTETKTAIDGTTFPQEGHIGLFLFKDEMATELYGESGYENVDYSYNQTKSKWTASP